MTLDHRNAGVAGVFVEMRAGRARALVRRGYEPFADRLGLLGDPADAADSVAGGRAAHPVVELDGGEHALVRRYRRGGAVRHVNGSRYFLGHRSYHELRMTELARSAGVRVPTVLAAAERRLALGYRAWLATLLIPGARDLVAWLTAASSSGGEAALERVGLEVGLMHAGGIAHPDLNLRNVLVAEHPVTAREAQIPRAARGYQSGRAGPAGPAVHLIDFDRARAFAGPVPEARRRRDLERFARSGRKLGALIPPRAWEAFRAGYGGEWPGGLSLG